MFQLFYFPNNANLAAHIVLEELGVPYELVLVDRAAAAHKAPAYLDINPTGRIPALKDPNLSVTVFESAAIVAHLVDIHGESPLGVSGAARALHGQWLIFLTSSLQEELMAVIYPHRHGGDDEQACAAVKQQATARALGFLDVIETHLHREGPYFLGDRFSAVDCFFFMLAHWAQGRGLPLAARPAVVRLMRLVAARPAVQRAFAGEETTPNVP